MLGMEDPVSPHVPEGWMCVEDAQQVELTHTSARARQLSLAESALRSTSCLIKSRVLGATFETPSHVQGSGGGEFDSDVHASASILTWVGLLG